jgi:hypothetical protein
MDLSPRQKLEASAALVVAAALFLLGLGMEQWMGG